MDAATHTPGPRTRVVALAAGSGGDVAPIAAIAARLAARGIATTLMAPARYAALCPPGVAFTSIGADAVFDAVFDDPAVWTARDGLSASWRYYAAAARTAHEALRTRWSPHDTVLVSSTFAVGARLAEASHGFCNTTVHLSPAVMFSRACPPRWPAMSIPRTWPQWLQAAAAGAAEHVAVDPVIRRHLTPALREAGVPTRHRLFSRFVHSPHRVAHLFPAWFAPAAADWPASGRHAGFAHHRPTAAAMHPRVAAFVARGDAPLVVVTGGSAVTGRPAWVTQASLALSALGAKVLVLEPGHAEPAEVEPGRVLHASWVPLDAVLPHARLIVHHAGIGTAVDALRAGTPQWLVPTAHDQPDNADRLYALGVGRVFAAQATHDAFAEAWQQGWPEGTHRTLLAMAARVDADGDGVQRVADWVASDLATPRRAPVRTPALVRAAERAEALMVADPPLSVGAA